MTILVTGAAGFIGSTVSNALLDRGDRVIGVDNFNDYYDVALKEARADRLNGRDGFSMIRADISDREAIAAVFNTNPDITAVIHLAAQAGVRYSLINPYAYIEANVEGHVVLLESAKTLKNLKHFVYASSSSVYGANTKLPFSVDDPVEHPVSLYAATKRSMELISESYMRMFDMPLTGLRFFTVYGPWGRPDMAAYIFTRKIFAGDKIPVFNNGEMKRDFTFIDDIVAGLIGCLDHPANGAFHRVYNLGNHRSENLMDFIRTLEDAIGIKAELDFQPMQPGDVKETYADIEASQRDFGFEPKTSIAEGIPKFVAWYRSYHGND
ncbi:MAG: NAD-dependent epimerase/dehydratase family protein [Rhodospirillales bacterium]